MAIGNDRNPVSPQYHPPGTFGPGPTTLPPAYTDPSRQFGTPEYSQRINNARQANIGNALRYLSSPEGAAAVANARNQQYQAKLSRDALKAKLAPYAQHWRRELIANIENSRKLAVEAGQNGADLNK